MPQVSFTVIYIKIVAWLVKCTSSVLMEESMQSANKCFVIK